MRAQSMKVAAAGMMVLALAFPGRAQEAVQIPGPNLRATLRAFGDAAGSVALGDALAFGPALELATAPLGSVTGGFSVSFDPSTGGFTRTAETFGPAFPQRALTTGRHKASFGLTWQRYTFDEIGGAKLDDFAAFTSSGFLNLVPVESRLGFDLKSSTVSLFATVGVTDRIDIGVVVPVVSTRLEGRVTQKFLFGPDARDSAEQSATGIADIALQGKVQLWRSRATAGGTGAPRTALAAVVGVRLPTGDEENLHGLGFARTKVSAVFSQFAPRFAVHANVGYEFWSDQLRFAQDILESKFATTNGAFEFALGTEFAAHSRLTLNLDLLMQQVRGAGALGVAPFEIPNLLVANTIVGLDEGLRKVTLVPGFRWNIFGRTLLNTHVLVSLKNDGLRAKITPSVGLDFTF